MHILFVSYSQVQHHFGVLKQAELSADRRRTGKTLIPEEDYHSPDQDVDNRAATPVVLDRDLSKDLGENSTRLGKDP